ncbi:GDP-L-fucose synthase family protein [Thauera mechernichensis]|uniref:GDP-L-fucose synthase n=1 Tax=Thauera mechernichensis TaxID=82788 RepID=A0ABW3WFH2_9RHOO|nr:GDP-L-fucose synthase [Thauera mechernichensis]MDG3064871.1 GDP-L-fucose synthase [Thauera mechernichensis]
MNPQAKIYVAGHRGMVGSAIVRQLKASRCENIVTRSHAELDLTNQAAVNAFFAAEKPDQVYLAAAKVGGIYANNTYPAQFIYENLMIEANIIQAAHANDVQQLLFLGSSCIYPKAVPQPMREDALLTGVLEATNEPYAIAKIAGIKLCESYNRQYGRDHRSVMPTNLYGPGDNYHLANSHVLPAMIRKLHLCKLAQAGDSAGIAADEAKYGEIPADIRAMMQSGKVTLWGTGTPYREFLHVDDMAVASIFVMNLDKPTYDANTQPMLSHIDVGYGSDLTIKEAACTVAEVVGYQGEIEFDTSKPDGTYRKLMDSSRLEKLGWKATIALKQGLLLAYNDYLGK